MLKVDLQIKIIWLLDLFTKSTVFKGFNLSIERSSNLLICLNYSLESFKVFHCSVFNVLFRCRSLLSATAHLYYHAVSCLSTTFLNYFIFCFISKASLALKYICIVCLHFSISTVRKSPIQCVSRISLTIITPLSVLVNILFIFILHNFFTITFLFFGSLFFCFHLT